MNNSKHITSDDYIVSRKITAAAARQYAIYADNQTVIDFSIYDAIKNHVQFGHFSLVLPYRVNKGTASDLEKNGFTVNFNVYATSVGLIEFTTIIW